MRVGTYNEYIMIYDKPRSRSFIYFVQRHSGSTFSNFFSFKNTKAFEAKWHMEPPWDVWMTFYNKYAGSHDQDGFQAHIL